jgi:hypothetical protein
MTALTNAHHGQRPQTTSASPSARYPTDRRRAVRIERARRFRRWAAIGLGCLSTVAACRGSDEEGSADAAALSRAVPVVMPSADQLVGFTRVPLVLTQPPPSASGTGADAPKGELWYRVGPSASSGDRSFEWYVHATHLLPTRAYRVDLTVDDNNLYSIGSGATDAGGSLTSHGTADGRFADEYCVGAPTTPLPVIGRHILALTVKSDGSGSGNATTAGALTDPGRSYPCHGNGDGVFDYWLTVRAPIKIGARSAH